MGTLVRRTLLFQVTPWRDLRVSRTIELLAKAQTLGDLHRAIQRAFGLDDDHLYAFFLNNRAWDREFEYAGPRVERSRYRAESAVLGELLLRPNKRFLYLFDFSDELCHEVRVVGERTAEPDAQYPRLVESIGAAPPQYHNEYRESYGDDARHEEPLPLPPGLAELVPGVQRALERYAAGRLEVGMTARPQAELREEAELALALLERTGGSLPAMHALEHAAEGSVWGWLCDLAFDLAFGGRTSEGLRVGEGVHAVLGRPPIVFTMPLLLTLAGRPAEGKDWAERNLDEYPDDALMLARAGDTFRALGDPGRAETTYRDGLRWAGSDTQTRRQILHGLEQALHTLGREDAIADLRDAERREAERRLAESWSAASCRIAGRARRWAGTIRVHAAAARSPNVAAVRFPNRHRLASGKPAPGHLPHDLMPSGIRLRTRLLERIELPVCESCGWETHRLTAAPRAWLLCPECSGE